MDYKKSDHFNGEIFFNPNGVQLPGLKEILRWKMQNAKQAWPPSLENKTSPKLPQRVEAGEVYITSIGHITHLIQINVGNVITDPVFSERASPIQWAGPKRVRPPALKLSELPKIDLVLISHNHYDHMDLHSLREINERHQPEFVVPLGNAHFLKSVGIETVHEMDWWETAKVSHFYLQCVPAQHWSSRTPLDRNRALWSGFVINSEALKIYFAGDTGYGSHFQEIAKRAGPISVSLLPIGAYEPRWFMKGQHMDPQDAVRAHLDLRCPLSLGTHFGTFQLTDEAINAPVEELQKALQEKGLPLDQFPAPDVGETIHFSI